MSSQPVNPLVTFSEQAAQKLLVKLLTKVEKAQDKYDYYDADNDIRDFGISIPKKMIHHHPGVGWASRAVNTLSDRVVFDGFAGDKFGINDYFDKINACNAAAKRPVF